ncbi:MAG TPA: serine hydrolase domain-containing protein [Vicinamibacterales bacterium]|nr:serine hydrolase domain-containing protein [Vicinamibacterales bacterium]
MTSYPLAAAFLVLSLAQAPPPDRAARVDEVFKEFAVAGSPGCTVAVYQDGKAVLSRAYGMANLDHDVRLTPSSVFHVASVSKQFTAAAILLLAQDGKLTLDDDIRKHLPELPDFGKTITIRHLIHHTSGIRDQWSLLGLAGWRYSRDLITDDDVLSLLSRQKELNFTPGERHLYSNSGYTLLAVIVNRVSGKSFREFTDERIFRPLGMTKTHFRDDFAEVVKNQAYGYTRQRGTFKLSVTNFDTAGATSLLTTAEDLARWDANFQSPVVGGTALVAAMEQRGRLNDGREIDYASGIVHGTYRGLKTINHGGSDAGYRSALLRYPNQRFGVSTLCNLAQANPTQLAQRVAEVYLEDQMQPVTASALDAAPEVPLPAAELSALAGLYWNAREASARRVVFEDGQLKAQSGAQQTTRLKSIGNRRFVFEGAPTLIVFDSGRVTIGPEAGPTETFERVEPFAPTPAQLEAFAGVYRSDEIEATFRTIIKDGRLRLERLKSAPSELEPLVADTFSGQPGVIRFTRDASGAVTGFVLEAGRVRGVKFWKETAPARRSSDPRRE